ncbi:hypothetical protein JZ751_008690 [Albula glossodonta]|uniref:Uncharacterized protein n=1 Tax=Albula glossodonta TaxID=121402 RepID=A0A8T2P1C4_9TELE|nr:hypothetical protein JZ751_008690 [Albula glossodonta]
MPLVLNLGSIEPQGFGQDTHPTHMIRDDMPRLAIKKGSVNAHMKLVGFSTSNKLKQRQDHGWIQTLQENTEHDRRYDCILSGVTLGETKRLACTIVTEERPQGRCALHPVS